MPNANTTGLRPFRESARLSGPAAALAEGLAGQLAHSSHKARRLRSHCLISRHDVCSCTSITLPHDWLTRLISTAANLLPKNHSTGHPFHPNLDGWPVDGWR